MADTLRSFNASGHALGHKIIMATLKKKQIHILIVIALMILVVTLLYPIGNKLLLSVRGQSYSSSNSSHIYSYSLPKKLVIENTSALPTTEAVPILTYHGVIADGEIATNTGRKTFISQMEMLKQKGYETISVKEYDLFRDGKFRLPKKPIIITFDDGRKDSFYTVDEILEKLGFKATIFLATIKANKNDPFYLSWDELVKVQATGRWEIEAHGRRSHDEIQIDEKGTLERQYLISRIYTPGKGLESVEEYKKRVEADYVNGIADIKEHLGIDARYFAVPLGDYGSLEVYNYKDAYEFNQELTRRFFKFAFIQAYHWKSFYNYRDSNPYILNRLGVRNMSSDDLLKELERFAAKPKNLAFSKTEGLESFLQDAQLLYGNMETNGGITLLSIASTPPARILFGDRGWKNYSIKIRMVREKGRSAVVIVYYADEDNFISLNWSKKILQLTERADGKERELASYYPWEKEGEVEVLVRVRDGYVSAYFSGIVLAQGLPIKLSRGTAGFGVWDPKGAQSTIRKLEIVSLDK